MESTIGKNAFVGMQGEENIARTYLMAKNIVDSDRVRDEYSYYDITTNVITRTAGQDDNHVLLSDFQKVELDRPIFVAGEGRTHEDTDNDGIYDGNELDVKRPIDVTYFVWKTLYAEVFGKEKETLENRVVINNLINQYKVNVANVNNTRKETIKNGFV